MTDETAKPMSAERLKELEHGQTVGVAINREFCREIRRLRAERDALLEHAKSAYVGSCCNGDHDVKCDCYWPRLREAIERAERSKGDE